MGGTGILVNGLVRKYEELGGTLVLNARVDKILITDGNGGTPKGRSQAKSQRVITEDGHL